MRDSNPELKNKNAKFGFAGGYADCGLFEKAEQLGFKLLALGTIQSRFSLVLG